VRQTRSLELKHMKMQPDRLEGVNVIARHETGRLWVGAQAWTGAVVVPHRGEVRAWTAASFEMLSAADFAALALDAPEIVIFGSGQRHRFVHPSCLAALHARHIGVETMDTRAACRTYNVLATEGRRVLAALLV
jgi:uncharacterized protein